MNEPCFLSATMLVADLRARTFTCLELLDRFIARIEKHDTTINAVVVRDFERARDRARILDEALAKGDDPGPLGGLPMTVKECFDLAGTPTTFGLEARRDPVAERDGLEVRRLTDAGAVIFGKTNVPPWLADAQSANPVYGRTCNPWAPDRTPGGSSGGAAAAVAAGLTGLEIGTDVASSLRNPAHFCGVYAHKPTWGLGPSAGHSVPGGRADVDMSAVGPIARSAADLAMALDVLAGPGRPADRAWRLELPKPARTDLRDHRIALVLDDPVAEVDGAVQARLQALGEFLRGEGATVDIGARPDLDSAEVFRLFVTLLRAGTADRQTEEDFARNAELARELDMDATDLRIQSLRGNTLSHRDWLRLNERRLGLRERWEVFFERYDLLMCPAWGTAAFPHDDTPAFERRLTVNGREVPYGFQLFWGGYTGLAYLPATTAPIGLTPDGLPVGVQIVGPCFADLACIQMAQMIERGFCRYVPPPALA